MVGGLKAEIVIKNANVITIDPSMPRAGAIAVSDGKIIGVGSNQDIEGLTGPGTKVLDVGDRTVLPGFIDAHTHVMSSGVRHVTQVDCAQPSIEAIQAALRDQASKKRPGEWVQGFNFDDTKTAENRFLTRAGPGCRKQGASHLCGAPCRPGLLLQLQSPGSSPGTTGIHSRRREAIWKRTPPQET